MLKSEEPWVATSGFRNKTPNAISTVCVVAIIRAIQTPFVPTESAGTDWVASITDRIPLVNIAEDGTAYNSNLPNLTEGWW